MKELNVKGITEFIENYRSDCR